MPPLIARIRLRGSEAGYLYLTDWTELPQPQCALEFVTQRREVPHARLICDPRGRRAEVVYLRQEELDQLGTWITVGTVDSSIEELRLTFLECGTRTYRLDGPALPSFAGRRVFLLEAGSCEWERAEALRSGNVVGEYEQPGAGYVD